MPPIAIVSTCRVRADKVGDGEMSGNRKSVSMLGKGDRIVEGNTSQIGRLEPIFQPPLGLCNRFRDRGR